MAKRAEQSPPSNAEEPSRTAWREALALWCPATQIPGYWETLQENCSAWAHYVTASPFWRKASAMLPRWNGEYHGTTGASLLMNGLPGFRRFRGQPQKYAR